jgi:hypothetical protein
MITEMDRPSMAMAGYAIRIPTPQVRNDTTLPFQLAD